MGAVSGANVAIHRRAGVGRGRGTPHSGTPAADELQAAGVLPVADEVRRSPRVAAATTDAPTLLDEP
ncbi:hypothetical protein BH23ACT7_BH23ACT7_08560 [soil metagenome]|jgi:hypothetical protein